MRVVAIIEARMTSSRLPGKVLLPVLGISMLERLITRLKSVSNIDEIVVATTTNSQDDLIVELCESLKTRTFRGSELDVFQRVIGAAIFAEAEIIVEITGDCPIIDPNLIENAVETFKFSKVDYLSNCEIQTFPAGMEIQVVKLQALVRSYSMTNSLLDKEHVTLHIRKNPELFKHMHITAPLNLLAPELSVTLDERADFELITFVIEQLEPTNFYFGCGEIVNLLKSNEKMATLNSGVRRKGDT
jgi:spore coat polysaccharide biosynthesis protein SpsF